MLRADEPPIPELTEEERTYTGDRMDRKALMAHKKVLSFSPKIWSGVAAATPVYTSCSALVDGGSLSFPHLQACGLMLSLLGIQSCASGSGEQVMLRIWAITAL